jgi:hypothetical protein
MKEEEIMVKVRKIQLNLPEVIFCYDINDNKNNSFDFDIVVVVS